MENPVRLIAFYPPQYYPTPENGLWWEKGFTEQTNVARARPVFPGHYQAHWPADLGFYDLRLPEVREAQAALALEHGIYGFRYHHYWFQSRRFLERPLGMSGAKVAIWNPITVMEFSCSRPRATPSINPNSRRTRSVSRLYLRTNMLCRHPFPPTCPRTCRQHPFSKYIWI